MYCVKCGNELANGVAACTACGASLVTDRPVSKGIVDVNQDSEIEKAKKMAADYSRQEAESRKTVAASAASAEPKEKLHCPKCGSPSVRYLKTGRAGAAISSVVWTVFFFLLFAGAFLLVILNMGIFADPISLLPGLAIALLFAYWAGHSRPKQRWLCDVCGHEFQREVK